MNFEFKQCTMQDITHLIDVYIKTLSSPFDSFLDDHIVSSKFYTINKDLETIGYFAIHEDKMITQFYLKHRYISLGQKIFDEMLQTFNLVNAFVPTCDELLLSLVLDKEVVVKKQAYFFQDGKLPSDSSNLYNSGIFRIATKEDISEILRVTTDFFDKLEERVEREEIFVLMENAILIGAGIIEKGRVLKGYTSIGMFTNEAYRQKGIGRTIITNLKNWCYENNQIPICGCWYYNTKSKMTLESSGFVTKTRLLNIEFCK
jgi:GNAT superfamily N-acetyltransferase